MVPRRRTGLSASGDLCYIGDIVGPIGDESDWEAAKESIQNTSMNRWLRLPSDEAAVGLAHLDMDSSRTLEHFL